MKRITSACCFTPLVIISIGNCSYMYLLVCILRFAKKFPQVCFRHEIRLHCQILKSSIKYNNLCARIQVSWRHMIALYETTNKMYTVGFKYQLYYLNMCTFQFDTPDYKILKGISDVKIIYINYIYNIFERYLRVTSEEKICFSE